MLVLVLVLVAAATVAVVSVAAVVVWVLVLVLVVRPEGGRFPPSQSSSQMGGMRCRYVLEKCQEVETFTVSVTRCRAFTA